RALRSGVTAHDQRERKGGVPGATGDPANRGAARRRYHHRFHFVLAALLDEDRVLPGRAAGSGAGGSAAGWAVAPVVSKWSKCITTLPSNVITSPFPVILIRSEVIVPLVSLTSTCSSDVTTPFAISTKACVRRAS